MACDVLHIGLDPAMKNRFSQEPINQRHRPKAHLTFFRSADILVGLRIDEYVGADKNVGAPIDWLVSQTAG